MRKLLSRRRSLILCSLSALIALIGAGAFGIVTLHRNFAAPSDCVGNERLLILAMQQYLQENDGQFPSMTSQPAFQKALQPYVQNPSTFICPDTGQPYVPNAYYDHKSLASISDISAQPIFEDSEAHSDGLQSLAYEDGVVTRGGVVQGDTNAACTSNLKALALGTEQYLQDYDEMFPPMDSQAHFEAAVMPYVRDSRQFVCPQTGDPYIPNAALNGDSLADIANPSTTAMISDAVAHANGIKTVAYVDGHVDPNYPPSVAPVSTSQATNAECTSNLKAVSLGVLQYTQDWDEYYPPMDTQAHFEAAVLPYVRDSSKFICPATGKPYVPNPALSYVSEASIAAPSSTIMLSDAVAHANGIKTVAYADGHVKPNYVNSNPPPDTSCYSNEKQIGLALQQYIQDYDEMLPLMDSYSHFESELLPYTRNAAVFTCPDNNAPYVLNTSIGGGQSITSFPDPSSVEVLRDPNYNNDGTFNTLYLDGHVNQIQSDIPEGYVLRSTDTGQILWGSAGGSGVLESLSSSGSVIGTANLTPPAYSGATYTLGQFDIDPRGNAGLIWTSYVPQVASISTSLVQQNSAVYGPYDGWTLSRNAVGPNGVVRLLWTKWDGSAAVWTTDPWGNYISDIRVGPVTGRIAAGFVVGKDNLPRVLWAGADGTATVLTIELNNSVKRSTYTVPGDTAIDLVNDVNNQTHILWRGANGAATMSRITSNGIVSELSVNAPSGYTVIGGGIGKDGLTRFMFRNANAARLYIVDSSGGVVGMKDYSAPSTI